LQLLLTLIEQPNVLMLDEPTNDLDLDTLRALEEYLDDWPGIVVVVSHDRVFLDRTVIDVLALDGEGGTRQVVGGIAGWLQQRSKQTTNQTAPKLKSAPALDSVQPTKVKPAKSPSTLRRLLGQTEKTLTQATEKLQKLERELSTVGNDHVELARVSAELALAQQSVDTAEEHWLTIAAEAESQGITSSQ
jgi:ATP-binding cassette subfamily F protein uup